MIPKEIWVVQSHMAIFNPSQTDQKESWEEQLSIDYDAWENICKLGFDKPHNFIFYNRIYHSTS